MQNAKLVGNRPGQVALRVAAAALLVAAVLLLVVHLPAEAQANDRDVGGVTVTSPNPGELVIAWDAPGNAPDDYRVTWKKSDGKWHSYKKDNTVDGGNAFPTGTSHTVTGLEEGTAYKARVRARYHNSVGKVKKSGPWSAAQEVTVSVTPAPTAQPPANEGRSTNPPAKPAGLITAASYDNVLLSWDNPDDDTITGYQVLRGPDADNLAALADDTGDANASYTDSNVAAETTYVYAVKARNADGLSPQSDPVSVTTPAAPPEEEEEDTALSTDQAGTITLQAGEARELSFERHRDVDEFGFTASAGTTYRLSVHLIWPGSNSASVSIDSLGSFVETIVDSSSKVVLPGGVEYVFTTAAGGAMFIDISGFHWNANSDGKHSCGSGNCYWSSDYTILVQEVASVAESTSSSTDVCPSYESFPSSLQAACSMDIDDDVMGYINSQGDRDLWALVQFEENEVYTVKVHGDVDPNNKLGGARIQLFDQWGIPRAYGSSGVSQEPASLTMGQYRVKTYTGLYYLEVRSGSDDVSGAYRIEVITH